MVWKTELWRNRVVPKRLNQLLIHVRYFVKRHKGRCRCPLFIFKVDFTSGILLIYYLLLQFANFPLLYSGLYGNIIASYNWDGITSGVKSFTSKGIFFNKHVMLRCSSVFFLRWFLFVVSCRHGQALCEKYCWWKKSCTSWEVVDPVIYRVLAPSQVVSRISSINGISLLSVHQCVAQLAQLTGRPSLLHCYVKHQPWFFKQEAVRKIWLHMFLNGNIIAAPKGSQSPSENLVMEPK